MPNVTIEETVTGLRWQLEEPPTLIIEAADPFITGEGMPVNRGPGPFRVTAVTTLDEDGYVVLPEVALPSTEDSSQPRVVYHAFLLGGVYGTRMGFSTFGPGRGFRVPASPATTTWEALDANMGTSLPLTPGDRTVQNLIVTGNEEVAGELYAGGPATFDGPVDFNSGVSGAAKSFNGRDGVVALQSSDLNGLSGAGLVGVGTGTGGVSNTGSTSIDADTNEDGVGVVALRTRNLTRLQVDNDGRLSGSGIDRLARDITPYVNAAQYGWVGDGGTDNTVAMQTLFDNIAAAGRSAAIVIPHGEYLIGGALQEPTESKSQIILPKVGNGDSQLTIHLMGVSAPAEPWNCDSGTILRSTLGSGTGAVFGVKNDQGASCATAACVAANISSNVKLALEMLTIRLPVNPTNTAIDASRIRQFYARNLRIDTLDFAAGGVNPAFVPGSTIIPTPEATQPTTTTSFALKLPMLNLPNNAVVDGLFTGGFYNHVRTGELCRIRNFAMHCGIRGYVVESSIWLNHIESGITAAVKRLFDFVGSTAELAGFPDTVNTAKLYSEDIGVENDTGMPWSGVDYIVNDPNHYAIGHLWDLFYGDGADAPCNPTRPRRFFISRAEFPQSNVYPATPINGPLGSGMAVHEVRSGVPDAGTNSKLAWELLTTHQAGVNHGLGVFAVANDAIADGDEKRGFMIFVATDGAVDQTLTTIWKRNGPNPADFTYSQGIDRYGNFLNFGMDRFEPETVTVSGNAIAPTKQIVRVTGGGLIKNITLPNVTGAAIPATGFVLVLIPDGTPFTMDTTGNVQRAVNPAAYEPVMVAYNPDTGKCYCK